MRARWVLMMAVVVYWVLAIPAPLAVAAGPDVASVTHVTGRLISTRYDDAGTIVATATGSQQRRGLVQVQRVAWSDPRLPSHMRTVLNIDGYMLESREGVLPFRGSLRLEGLTGWWSGTQRGVLHADGCFWQDLLIGEGAYRGLFAVLDGRMEFDAGGAGVTVWEGYIFEGTEPPKPDPLPYEGVDKRLVVACTVCT
jgi:hypothetical protein